VALKLISRVILPSFRKVDALHHAISDNMNAAKN
jgi:hypothetical protein